MIFIIIFLFNLFPNSLPITNLNLKELDTLFYQIRTNTKFITISDDKESTIQGFFIIDNPLIIKETNDDYLISLNLKDVNIRINFEGRDSIYKLSEDSLVNNIVFTKLLNKYGEVLEESDVKLNSQISNFINSQKNYFYNYFIVFPDSTIKDSVWDYEYFMKEDNNNLSYEYSIIYRFDYLGEFKKDSVSYYKIAFNAYENQLITADVIPQDALDLNISNNGYYLIDKYSGKTVFLLSNGIQELIIDTSKLKDLGNDDIESKFITFKVDFQSEMNLLKN